MPLWCLKGGLPSLLPTCPAFSLRSFPHPPCPPSRREGGDFRLFYARGCAPCIPATEPVRHWEMGANQAPGRGHGGFACRIALPLWEPGGGHNGFGRRSIFYFSRFSAPLPRRGRISPRPPSRREGGNQGYFMQGAAPLASPRLSRRRHGLHLRCRCPLGCLPGWSPADLAVPESVGGACPLCRLPPLPLA